MRRGRTSTDARKIQQLCRQVERRLSLVFAGELEDPALEGLVIHSVTPIAGSSLLKVEVSIPGERERAEGERPDRALILAKLSGARAWLRSEVASAINRKRTPQLIFSLASVDDYDQCEA